MATATIYADTGSGLLRTRRAHVDLWANYPSQELYLLSRNDINANNYGSDPVAFSIAQSVAVFTPPPDYNLSYSYDISRAALIFDTSSIPEGATITDVKLYLRCYEVGSGSFNLVIQKPRDAYPAYPHNPIISEDYYYSIYAGDGGSKSGTSFAVGWNYITFNETGLDWIQKEGTTKLFLRTSKDISATRPIHQGGEFLSFYFQAYLPYLVITYDLAEVTTQAATQIAYECAMGNGTVVSGTNITERGFEVKVSFSGTLNEYIHHSIADFDGTANYNTDTGNWEGILTKTESETGNFAEGAYELVLGYPSVLGNPSHVFNDKLFKCESYTYRARATIDGTEYYGAWVAFSTLCDEGGDQEVEDDISDGNPTEPIIPIEPLPEPEIPEWELPEWEEPELPPWEFPEMPPWEYPDFPPMSWIGDFYYRKPYTQKDLDELRKKCIIYNKNSIEFALVLRHNMNVLKEFFNMMTDYMDKEEFNDFTDLIPPQRLKELYLDPLEPVDFRDMINGFISNTIDNNMAVNRNFKLIQDGLSDYETGDDADFRDITSNIKPLIQDDPDVERMKRLIDSLNKEVSLNFTNIMHNLEIIRARLL